MRPEELDKAKKLIQSSTILSSVERAEWSQLLPQMNDKQVNELIRILSPRAPKPQAAPANLPIADYKQKEITTSRPFYEPEIEAPKPNIPPQPKKQEPVPAPADPTDLQHKVASIVKELDQRKAGMPATPPVKPIEPYRPQQPQFKAPFKAESRTIDLQNLLEQEEEKPKSLPPLDQGVEEQAGQMLEMLDENPSAIDLPLNTAGDFANLDVDFINNRNLEDVHRQLTEAIRRVSKKEQPYDIIANFESSPLHQAYVNLGAALLDDPNPDRIKAYESAQMKLKQQGLPALNKQAFEFLTDLRSELQHYY